VDLEKVRAAAERVARSAGLEVVDVEWKVGKQRFLRVYIDRLPPRTEGAATSPVQASEAEQRISHRD
jgi:ribosome maturation factor RimP